MLDFNLGNHMNGFMSFSLAVVRKSSGAWSEWQHLGNKEAIRNVQVRDDIVCTGEWLLFWWYVYIFKDLFTYLFERERASGERGTGRENPEADAPTEYGAQCRPDTRTLISSLDRKLRVSHSTN